MNAIAPKRPVLRWHGGKWRLAPWIIEHLPPHRVYVEPFGGAASVLLRKPRAYAEIYNDLDGEAVNLFQVLRDAAQAARLCRDLSLTPFARQEFERAYEPASDPVERARRLIVRSYMGFGAEGNHLRPTGFRANSNRSHTTPAGDWRNYPDEIGSFVERLRGVVIESRDAITVMRQHDGPETLHYLDPPYVQDLRSPKRRAAGGGLYHVYAHELTDDDHANLLGALGTLTGMIVLSGYPCALYDAALKGWHQIRRAAMADGARPRTEVLWLNPAAAMGLSQGNFLHAGGA